MKFWWFRVVVLLAGIAGMSTARADVVSEYRDRDSTGFIASTYLFQNEAESSQQAIENFGEYDVTDWLALTGRLTLAKVKSADEGNNKYHIASAGLRFHWPVGDYLRAGFKTNIVERDYFETNGQSFRFMPVIEVDPFDFLHMRYIYEFDYIPESARRKDPESGIRELKGGETEQETALYIRLMADGIGQIPDVIKPLSYEVKVSSGVGHERDSGRSKWGLGFEHHLFWAFDNGISLKYARARTGSDWGHHTVGMSFSF